jgi:TPR repeat protein
MAPSRHAKQLRRETERGTASAEEQWLLGGLHERGEEGVTQDNVKASSLFRRAADRGHLTAHINLSRCYDRGHGVEQSRSLAVEWLRKGADLGSAGAQFAIGKRFARGHYVKKDLPLGKMYLELCAAHGRHASASLDAVALLRELRKCVACGKLDVHHMICSRCRNVRYCDAACQLRHWNSPADPHTLHCSPRR